MLSKDLETTLNEAFRVAKDKRHEFMTVEHLLLALLDNTIAVDVLKKIGADLSKLRLDLDQYIDSTTPVIPQSDSERETQPTLGFQRVLQRAVFHVQSSGRKEVTGANVLVAIFSEQESQAVYFLKQQNIARIDVVNFISHGISKVPDEDGDSSESATEDDTVTDSEEAKPSALESFATNLNEEAKAGRIDPLVGRDTELERVIQILCRRRKNNPLLVGESGVGKTAIAEGLAKRIIDQQVPEVVANAEIFSLDLGALLAGTKKSALRRFWRTSSKDPVQFCLLTKSTPLLGRVRRLAALWMPLIYSNRCSPQAKSSAWGQQLIKSIEAYSTKTEHCPVDFKR